MRFISYMSVIAFVVIMFALFITGCNTTFEERKEVYKAAWAKIAPVVETAGKIAAEKAVDKYEADGKIDKATADQLKESIKNFKGTAPGASTLPNIGFNTAKQAKRNGAINHTYRKPMLC
jgi:PBP1b-binding outer membrane lipoprotein LpoB